MCGIAGWIDWSTDIVKRQSALDAMVTPLTCRGPDGSGTWVSHNAGLGHRRLIVIDPEGGMQPMSKKVGNTLYTVVYNGELYNFQELRSELEALGYTFRSRSDTEVLLTSYMAWGADCVAKFNGIYAFAIWNQTDRVLFMARDRMGVKPLFYAKRGDTFIFASEIKSLLAHPKVDPVIDHEGLAEILAVGPARTPGHGVFKDIFEVRPGHYLLYSPKTLTERAYWKLQSRPHTDGVEATAETIRSILEDTVKRQLIADVPVVTLLSGGLDSSLVSALAAQSFKDEHRGPLNTYSIDFVDMAKYFTNNGFQTNMDAPWVKVVSEYLNTNHHRVVLDTPELSEHLLAALRARDFPGMADVDTSLLLFAHEIKKAATVGLSGEAADEVFGGYPWFHRQDSIQAETFPWAMRLDDRLSVFSPSVLSRIKAFDYVSDRYRQALDEVPRLPGENAYEARIREIGYLSLTRFLPTLLDRKDRMTMASSLEVRVPFCDHRLVEYVWNIPWSMKNHGNMAKGILRKASEGLLPDGVLYRKKSPYPSTPNPTYYTAMRDGLVDILNNSHSPLHDLINSSMVQRIIEQGPQAEQIPWFGQLMGNAQLFAYLIQLHHWFTEYHVTIQ